MVYDYLRHSQGVPIAVFSENNLHPAEKFSNLEVD